MIYPFIGLSIASLRIVDRDSNAFTSYKEFSSLAARTTIDMSDVEVVGEIGQKASRPKLLEHKART